MTRLEKSLHLLREVNMRRYAYSGWAGAELVRKAEAQLAQHDADARAGVDPRQVSIFDVLPSSAFRQVG